MDKKIPLYIIPTRGFPFQYYYVRLAPWRYPDVILTLSMRYASKGLIQVTWTEMVISQSLTNLMIMWLLMCDMFIGMF